MSIPDRARDLRKAFDAQNFFTLHTSGRRGFSHQLRVITLKNTKYILVMVYNDRYRVIDDSSNEYIFKEIPDVVEAVQDLLDGR